MGASGYHARRAALLASVRGVVLEIGAGEGANFGSLAAGIRWVGAEPGRRLPSWPGRPVLAAVAERLPLRDGSVDAVVSTNVLCSVRDQDRVLAEVRRVLRPGGAFVFCEHVAAPGRPVTRLAQRIWAALAWRFDDGCRTGRPTWRAIERAGFARVELDWYRLPGRGLYNPFIAGRALA
jgi:SAM-dependent methyltransferase